VPGLGFFSNFYELSALPRAPEDTRNTSSAPASFCWELAMFGIINHKIAKYQLMNYELLHSI